MEALFYNAKLVLYWNHNHKIGLSMSKLIQLIVLFAIALFWQPLMAQVEITGTIQDVDGQMLIGATVQIEGTNLGTVTNIDGEYSLEYTGENEEITLVASYLGYTSESKTLNIANRISVTVDFELRSDVLGMDDVIVTGVVNEKTKIESSISISTVDAEKVSNSVPRNTTEIFRSIPGIRSESSAGEGNTNITVRGVPISAGGSKYLQLQEDGLPIMLYGDIAFATSDIFLRFDQTLRRLEVIRGGSASTLASNSPAGIINFISKNGSRKGGSVSTSMGLDYRTFRTGFEYGMPLSDDLNMHVGGFYRQGEGVRNAGYDANLGGQIKANLTKNFDKGYARVYFKYLNDRTAGYLPIPLQVSGTNSNPVWESIDGFNGNYGTPYTPNLGTNLSTGPDGNLRRSQLQDGMNPVETAVGSEFSFDLANGWIIDNKTRFSFKQGRFVSPFPAQISEANTLAESIAGAGATLQYAGTTTPFSSGISGNELAMRVHLFDVELNNFNTFFNDLTLSKQINDEIDITAGLFKGQQNVGMSWLWNSYLMDVNGGDTRLLDVYAADGTAYSENGLYAYGTPFWGNLHRNYDTQYNVTAPYLALNWQISEALVFDGSVRWDYGLVTGSFAGGTSRQYDMNNDGEISVPEQNVYFINTSEPTVVDYTYDYISYSAGLNYSVNRQLAVFARASRGASAKADRILFTGLPSYTDSDNMNTVDVIDQFELGYKQRFENGGLFVTGFYALTTEEGGFEATTQKIIENDFEAYGLEIEGVYQYENLNLRSGITWTEAEITSGIDEGNTPRRQPALMYSITSSYTRMGHELGVNVIGQTEAYAQNNNELIMPAYAVVSAFVRFGITESLTLSVDVNNITNALGITESEEGAITNGQINYVRARPITGRSIQSTLRFTF